MHRLTFYPLGNADTCRIELQNGRTLLFDYAAIKNADDPSDKRIDLPAELRRDLKKEERNYYDVVAFTHIDDDHVHGSSDYFYLEHASKYQSADRIRINELWVPAAAIYDTDCDGDARVIREEARHRLRTGKGIKVFSRPERLREWLEKQGLTLESRKHLIVDAGQLIPGFTLASDEVEFFLHSPFAFRTDRGELIDRNGSSIVVQGTFTCNGRSTTLMLAADVTYDVLDDIVTMTKRRNNHSRLESDVFKLPHHGSFTAIGPDKGESKTKPTPNVAWLYEEQCRHRCTLVCSSRKRPSDESDNQPPHRQAIRYYEDVVRKKLGEFIITMESPTSSAPEPLVVILDGSGATVQKKVPAAAGGLVTTSAPRAGA